MPRECATSRLLSLSAFGLLYSLSLWESDGPGSNKLAIQSTFRCIMHYWRLGGFSSRDRLGHAVCYYLITSSPGVLISEYIFFLSLHDFP